MEWRRLTSTSLRGHNGRHVLITRADGKGHYGEVKFADAGHVVLANGTMNQTIVIDRWEWHYCFITPPVRKIPKMGERRLPL